LNDPAQQHNVAKQHPELSEKYMEKIRAWQVLSVEMAKQLTPRAKSHPLPNTPTVSRAPE
jgi:hypothetical protein